MKNFQVSLLVTFLLLVVFVNAANLEINVQPADVWLGDGTTISCWYQDNSTTNPLWAYIMKDTSSWIKSLTKNDTFYQISYNPPMLGNYQVYCSDVILNSSQTSFQANTLVMNITNYPSTVYLGNKIVLHAKVIKKSDSNQIINSGVSFQLYLNDKNVPIDADATYSTGDEWVITTQKLSLSDFTSSSYTLMLKATYSSKIATDSKIVQVSTPLEFELISIDKTWVMYKDNITFTFKALYEGNTFDFKNEYLRIWINSKDVNVLDISQNGAFSYVKISVPDLQPGAYKLDIRFTYSGFIKDISTTINYALPISGSIIDSENKPVYVQLRFKSNTTDVTYATDGSGSYTGYLLPGIYEVEMTFPNAKLVLDEVMISQFSDPIKFDHPSASISIPGIGVGTIFVYEVQLTYSSAYLEMKYDDTKITDESRVSIYKCENWNFGRRTCNSNWNNVQANIDTIRNTVKINTTQLSAFVIGYKKNLYLSFSSDKDEYYLKDVIKLTGTIEDEEKNPITDAQINVNIPNTGIAASAKSDNSGVFVLEFQGPEQEGDFSIFVKADKPPFASVNETKKIKLSRSKQLLILLSESMKVSQGTNGSIPIDIINKGQTDFSGLKLSLTGVPEEYGTLSKTEISELKVGSEEKVFIDFVIPKDADKTSYTGKLQVKYDGGSYESEFILSVLTNEKNETAIEPTSWFKLPSLPTGMFVLPDINIYLLVMVVAISVFSTTLVMKNKKSKSGNLEKKLERVNIKNLLLDIKREIETRSLKKKK
jgi:hypothetical protein